MEGAAQTVIAVAADGRLLGLVGIADEIKPDAAEAVRRLRSAGVEPVMITGDNERTAHAVAAQVGIAEVRSQVLPHEKAAAVRDLQRQGHRVMMVGDGINDAPALTQADVGIAIGAGTDIAMESSDIVLVGRRLTAVAEAREIGRRSYRKTKQNLAIEFAFNGIGVPAAITGYVQPVWAMVAMISSVSAVLANSFGARLRLGSLTRLGSRIAHWLRLAYAELRDADVRALARRPRLQGAAAIVAATFLLGLAWQHGRIPTISGFYEGRSIAFVHTEASNAQVARKLTGMTGFRVAVVPRLAHTPAAELGNVYVFATGPDGAGPLGHQADVFDGAPGDPGYSPLRALNLVTWARNEKPRALKSAAAIKAAAAAGQLEIRRPRVVINMPFVSSPREPRR